MAGYYCPAFFVSAPNKIWQMGQAKNLLNIMKDIGQNVSN